MDGPARRVPRICDRFRPRIYKRVFRERDRRFDQDVFKLGDSVYLDGYWQSERYFAPIAEYLRESLDVIEPMGLQDASVADEIFRSSVSIGVHFRLANYSTGPANAHHGLCSYEYYAKAIEHFLERFSNAKLFVFSDDINAVRASGNLDRFNVAYVEHNNGYDGTNYVNDKNYQDLRLLSRCDHQIIANSTFSWWAAWLNKNSHKQVIAPRRWFADGSPCNDIVPNAWLRI